MTDAYCNMSAPPRTTVCQVFVPIGRQVVFNIHGADFTHPFKSPQDFPTPRDWLDDFLARHGDALDAVQRPSGYMIGDCLGVAEGRSSCGEGRRICRDPVLTVAILGRVSGTVYIPRRRILFGEWLEKHAKYCTTVNEYSFPERYFPQFQKENRP